MRMHIDGGAFLSQGVNELCPRRMEQLPGSVQDFLRRISPEIKTQIERIVDSGDAPVL